MTGAEAEPRAPFAPSWSLDALIEEALAGLEHGEAGDAKRIDGRALAVKASPMKGNSEHIVTGMAALPPGFTTRAHSHAAEEVAVFLRGSGRVDIDGVPHRVEAGTVLVTPSDLVHVTHSDPGDGAARRALVLRAAGERGALGRARAPRDRRPRWLSPSSR